jgi:inosine-uridine nucleoside N-ribohydrolase
MMIRQTDTVKKTPGSIRQQIAIALILIQSTILFSCNTMKKQEAGEMIRVIFDTDIGADIDDALALAMLYNYMDLGWIDMLAVMSCKDNPYSARYIDIMNIWYGYPDMPIGIVINGVKHDTSAYTRHVVEMKMDGKPVFARSLQDGQKPPVAINLYRKLLSESPDSSVVIIAVGQSTNLARLIDSEPDEYSPLSGLELVSRKVDYLSMMAGNFRESRPETNIFNDSAAAARVLESWPSEIWFSPFDVGWACPFPGKSIQNDFSNVDLHPLVEAYKNYQPMPYDRPAWDLTSVLFVVERDSSYFTISPPGKVSLGYEPDLEHHVVSHFTPDPQGKHRYLSVDDKQARRIRQRLVEVVSMDQEKK